MISWRCVNRGYRERSRDLDRAVVASVREVWCARRSRRLRLEDLDGRTLLSEMGTVSLDVATVTIGDDVEIGLNVQLLNVTYLINPGLRLEKWEVAEPIVIMDDVGLGGGVMSAVCHDRNNTVVGAGAVVVSDLPANVVAVGNPAQVIRTFED